MVTMKTRTKLEVKSQRPKRYIKRDAGIVSANASQPRAWAAGGVGTYRCGTRERKVGLWGASSGASASRLVSVAGLHCPLRKK